MTVSYNNRAYRQLWSDLLVALGGSEAFLTRSISERKVLLEILDAYEATVSLRDVDDWDALLARVVVAAGGTASHLRQNKHEMLAALVTALGGDAPSPYLSSISQLLAAAVNAADTGGGGGGDYVAKAVHFNGVTSRTVNPALVSADSSVVSMSRWLKPAADCDGYYFAVDPEGSYTSSLDVEVADGVVTLSPVIMDSAANLFFQSHDEMSAGGWHHILFCANVGTIVDFKPITWLVYIDDVLVEAATSPEGDTGFTTVWNGLPLFIGTDMSKFYKGDVADSWIAPGVDLSVDGEIPEATRRLFISADGRPVNPAGFPTGAVMLSGGVDTYSLNALGTGGAFTPTDLTNATTSPSD